MIVISLVTLIVAFVFSYLHTTRWNPEMRFWKSAVREKSDWVESLRESQTGPITICLGGSATGFGIDAKYASVELNHPMANLGLHAGMGAEVLTGLALSKVKAGDILLVMLEPKLLASLETETALGVQFGYAIENPEILAWRNRDSESFPWVRHLTNLRPGASNLLGVVGKVVMARPLYRYQIEDIKQGGLLTTPVDSKIYGHRVSPEALTHPMRQLFKDLAAIAREKGVQVLYGLPWVYCDPKYGEVVRKSRALLMADIEKIMPVLREDLLGVQSELAYFRDTPLHLTESAARMRTQALVGALEKMSDSQ